MSLIFESSVASLSKRVFVLLLLLLQACCTPSYGQSSAPGLNGQILDQATHVPLGFVSVSVQHHPFGTVADRRGYFSLDLPAGYDTDSVRCSLVGYASRTWQVAYLRRLLRAGPLLLQAQAVPLPEARVSSAGLKRRILGNSTLRKTMRIDEFAANTAGNQIGQRIAIKRPAFLEEVSFVITDYSYDTVAFRLNIYRVKQDYPAENILPTSVYFRVSRQQTQERIHLNLRRYHLYLTDDVVVALELVHSLGQGTLEFGCQLAGGGPFYKLQQTPGPATPLNVKPKNSVRTIDLKQKQPDGPWTKYPSIGLGIDATVLEIPAEQ